MTYRNINVIIVAYATVADATIIKLISCKTGAGSAKGDRQMPKTMRTINRLHRLQTVFRQERLGREICAAHHVFVFTICNHPGLSQDEIARALFLNKSTVTRALSSLEERGLVRRALNPEDKRQTLVYPTDAMLRMLPDVREIAAEWNGIIESGIPAEDLEVFYSVLLRMEKNAKDAIEGDFSE